MSGNRHKALLVSLALAGGAMLMTACQDAGSAKDAGAAQGSSSATPAGKAATPSGSSTAGSGQGTDDDAGATGTGPDGGEDGAGSGERESIGQNCGTNDISWSARSEPQAGGYLLIIAKAKSGITCVLPAAHPTVAFGSDGTEAGPAEQAVGKQITLSGRTAAYAGVNPKGSGGNGGKELDSIVVGISDDDPNPVDLPVGTMTVEDPIVTNWHTSQADAVPSP
ncbi:hypothetical protein [Streptomyces sp. NPDC020965]|uniref:hypothetical protein n=1 Tax=Streptomyces sp. NPDC020965 TaxID=3365105 RepID=UPI00378FB4E3